MYGSLSNIKRIKQVSSMIIDGLDLAQNVAKIVVHFISLPDFLTSGETYLIVKMIILMLTEIYITCQPVLLRLPSVLRALQEVWELIRIIYTFRHQVQLPLEYYVRPFSPVCVLVPARIGRSPKANLSLCRIIRPSSREGK